jgi:hypothetical protein
MVRPFMQTFIDDCRSSAGSSRQRDILRRIVVQPDVHARLLNTLARLEYVGVRKMLKARRADSLDLAGLQHILEEAVHAVRLKKFALAVAPEGTSVATFSDAHTLEGDAAERYFQAIDKIASACLDNTNPEACYWLTSTAIELRAKSFYPVYQEVLKDANCPVSVASIVADEQDHLDAMARQLPKYLSGWRDALTKVMQIEEQSFGEYLDRISLAVFDLPNGAEAVAPSRVDHF